MSDKLQRVEIDFPALKKAIESGNYSPEQVEAISTSIRVGLASSLMKSVAAIGNSEELLDNNLNKVQAALEKRLQIDIESALLQDLPYKELLDIFRTLSKAQLDVAEVKRRVFNGKDLFSVDPLSAQDRALMDLFKTIGSKEKKEKLSHFLQELSHDPESPTDEGIDEFDEEI